MRFDIPKVSLKPQDPLVFFLALALSGLGLLMSFDAGYVQTLASGKGIIPQEFRTQFIVFLAGPLVYVACSRTSLAWLKQMGIIVWIAVSGLLIAAIASPLRQPKNGAERWVAFGKIVVQPAEFAKFAVILYLAAIYARPEPVAEVSTRKRPDLLSQMAPVLRHLIPAVWVLIMLLLIDKEPDLGTAAIVGVIAATVFWLGGVRARTMLIAAGILGLGVYVMVQAEPYRVQRFMTHAQRWEPQNMRGSGFQSVHSEAALANGSYLGKGIGQGMAKHNLPEVNTDFVMATVGEEFGLLGVLAVLGALGALVYRLAFAGIRLLGRTPSGESQYAALVLGGTAAWLAIQGCVNLLQANGTLPPIGIPFPFISSGGSSLLALWMGLGFCDAALRGANQSFAEQKVEMIAEGGEDVEDRSYGRRNGRPYLSGS